MNPSCDTWCNGRRGPNIAGSKPAGARGYTYMYGSDLNERKMGGAWLPAYWDRPDGQTGKYHTPVSSFLMIAITLSVVFPGP